MAWQLVEPSEIEQSRHTLELLIGSEFLATSILDQATEAVIVVDRANNIVLANQAARELCGQDPLHQPFDKAFPLREGRGPRPWHLLERRKEPRLGPRLSVTRLTSGGIQRGQQAFLSANGHEYNVLVSAGPLRGPEERPLGCIITLTDITECVRAEDDSEEQQARIHRLADSNLVGTFVADGERIVDANDAFLLTIGYTRQDLEPGIPWRAITPREYREQDEREMRDLVSTGLATPYEKEYVRKDGRRVPVLQSAALLDASLLHWMGLMVDLTPRRSTEQALQNAQDRMEEALQDAQAKLNVRVQERTAELTDTNQALQAEIVERKRTEEALRQSRAEFQAFLESAPDAILAVNGEGKITLVNSQTEKMFGFAREELIGHPVEMLLPERFGSGHVRHREGYAAHPSTRPMGIGLYLAGRRKDGTEFPVEISLSPVPGVEGPLVMSIIRDITDRKLAEQAVAEQSRRLQQQANLIELAHDTIIVRDMNNRITFWNHGAEETYGWYKDEVLGKVTHDLLQTVFPVPLGEIEHTLVAEGQWEGELIHATRDGRKVIVSSRQVLQRDSQGQPLAILEINRDVTQRKHAEERLAASESRFRTLVQQVRDYAIFGLDPQGRVTSWNVGAERMNGYTSDEIIGKHFSIFFSPQDTESGKPDEELRQAADYGDYEEETQRVRRDGSTYWADVVITALRDPHGELRGFSKVIRDVTARKQAEEEIIKLNRELENRVTELAAVNQELEAFSYSVSHDLRAPLRAIAGFSQALGEDYTGVLDEQGQDYIRRVNAATLRMTQLIDDLLTLSRVTRSEMSRDAIVDLSAMAEAVIAQWRAIQPDRQVDVAIQPGLVAHGDPRLLRIALENLLGNAWKFTSKAESPRIEFGSAGTEDLRTIYYVRDNGAGFDMAYASKLFGPFQRLHGANEFPGTGIGLATVQRIIHRHGGRVWAESSVGRGATFYFTLG